MLSTEDEGGVSRHRSLAAYFSRASKVRNTLGVRKARLQVLKASRTNKKQQIWSNSTDKYSIYLVNGRIVQSNITNL